MLVFFNTEIITKQTPRKVVCEKAAESPHSRAGPRSCLTLPQPGLYTGFTHTFISPKSTSDLEEELTERQRLDFLLHTRGFKVPGALSVSFIQQQVQYS